MNFKNESVFKASQLGYRSSRKYNCGAQQHIMEKTNDGNDNGDAEIQKNSNPEPSDIPTPGTVVSRRVELTNYSIPSNSVARSNPTIGEKGEGGAIDTTGFSEETFNGPIGGIHHSVCCDHLLWIRILVLILTIFLFCLSSAFCVGQLIKTKLNIITECEPKTSEEIWAHSLASAEVIDGEPVLSPKAQFGRTSDPCWTTKSIVIDTAHLWDQNVFLIEWESKSNAKSVLFGLLSVYLILVIMFSVSQFTYDLIQIARGQLHLRSTLYKKHIRDRKRKNVINSKMILGQFLR